MTDDDIQEFLDMFEYIPNPEHYPRTFEFYVKWYKMKKEQQTDEHGG